MAKLRVLDLFSGIGGFSLGLERAGMTTVAFCEIEPYARRVLAKHWPHVPCYDDIRTLTAERLAADGISVDVICGGFPCQDISFAGRGAGLTGERSGLWSHYARLIGELRPRFVIVENVAALLRRGFGTVLGDLASHGYDAEWDCISAGDVGAPHGRDRVWITASNTDQQQRARRSSECIGRGLGSTQEASPTFYSNGIRELQPPRLLGDIRRRIDNSVSQGTWWTSDWQEQFETFRRMDDGLPTRLDKASVVGGVECLGNAVVPQIPEMIGRAILAATK